MTLNRREFIKVSGAGAYKGMIDYRPNDAPYRVKGTTVTVATEFDEV